MLRGLALGLQSLCWEGARKTSITLEKRFPVVTFFEFLPKPLACEATPADWKQVSCGDDVHVWGPGVLYGRTTYDPLIITMDQHFPCRHVPACWATIRSELPLSPKSPKAL